MAGKGIAGQAHRLFVEGGRDDGIQGAGLRKIDRLEDILDRSPSGCGRQDARRACRWPAGGASAFRTTSGPIPAGSPMVMPMRSFSVLLATIASSLRDDSIAHWPRQNLRFNG